MPTDLVSKTELSDKLIELENPRFERGYWQGMRQPAVLVTLVLTRQEVSASALCRFDEIVPKKFTPSSPETSARVLDVTVSQHPVLGRVLSMTLDVLEKMGMPVMGGTTAVRSDRHTSPRQWLVGLPAIAESVRAPQAAFSVACGLMNELAAGKQIAEHAVAAEVQKQVNRFRPLAPAGVNTLRFLEAAHEMGIPWRHVANNVFQFGWGARSRWLDSSFTDETSIISASLARDKVACAKVLRDAGLPVPKHHLVSSAEQAVKVAEALGYPVVVKPANLDGGLGVMAGLRDADGVRKAFAAASKLSNRILVEQFIAGNDYRIRVCNREVIGAVIRKPAAVVGDGVRSVQALVDSVNSERATLKKPLDLELEQGSKPIIADDEVQQWLAAQGLHLGSVVRSGQKVRLRGAANVSLGGTTWDVTRQAHPDNLELASQAAAALRLDVAGVDLLLPDIARSWKETGGAVCEVNGQPQFSSGDAHRRVLERLVIGQGRIPVVGIMQGLVSVQAEEAIVQALLREGVHAYIVSTALHCRQALQCVDADAVIWKMDGLPSLKTGLPVDRVALMIQPENPSAKRQDALFLIDEWLNFNESASCEDVIDRLIKCLCEARTKFFKE